jgi:hypothetical protein
VLSLFAEKLQSSYLIVRPGIQFVCPQVCYNKSVKSELETRAKDAATVSYNSRNATGQTKEDQERDNNRLRNRDSNLVTLEYNYH